jgi:hypothetical protein
MVIGLFACTCIWLLALANPFPREAWRYQRGNQNPQMKEEKDRQYNGQMKNHKQRSTKQKSKDRATRTKLKTDGERRCSGRVGNYYSIY